MNRQIKKNHLTCLTVLLALAAALLLPGCTAVGPDYMRPEVKMPQSYTAKSGEAELTEADQEALAHWWTQFNDPVLSKLVERALAGNLSLKEATAKLKQVRWERRVAELNLRPGGTISGNASESLSSDDDYKWQGRESFSTSLDVSWEADLFGGNRRQLESAEAEYQAAQEDLRDVLVSLTAETATAYVQLRTYQQRLQMARESLRLQEETLELARIKYQTGLAGGLNVQQAAYSLESTRSQIPDLESGLDEKKNRLAVLLGTWPGDLNQELLQYSSIPIGSLQTVVGVPANLLRRRPDIRAAERRLAARTADIGAAKSELYPKLTLSGSVGLESLNLGDLISPGSMVAALVSSISWPIFKLNTVRANIEVQNALQEQALVTYESALRTAVEEVENALTALAQEARKQEYLSKALQSAEDANTLALQGYQNGISDFQSVLENPKITCRFQG